MNDKSKREEWQKSAFIGEVSNPISFPENPNKIGLRVRPLQGGILYNGALEVVTRSGAVYPAVVRAIQRLASHIAVQNPGDAEEQQIVVEGLPFMLAERLHRLVQQHEPKIPAFMGTVSEPFSSPTLTRGFVALQIRPVPQDELLWSNGVLQPYGTVELISSLGEVYTAFIQGSSRPYFPLSEPTKFWLTLLVDSITLEQAQHIERITQNVGPEGTTAICTILEVMPSANLQKGVDVRVRILRFGLMRKGGGRAQLVSHSGEVYPVTIRRIIAVVTSDDSFLREGRREYMMSVDGIALAQAKDALTLVQEPEV